MANQVDIGNLMLNPGDYLDFEFQEVGTPGQIELAVKGIKDSLAHDSRWHYQGSAESQRDGNTYITITVQVSKSVTPAYNGASMATSIVPIVVAGIVVAASVIIGLVYAVPRAAAIVETHITARSANGDVRAIWENPDLTDAQKEAAAGEISQVTTKAITATNAPLVSTGGGMSLGLILVGGALLLFFLGSQRGR
jgi:hypothetical protein